MKLSKCETSYIIGYFYIYAFKSYHQDYVKKTMNSWKLIQ